MEAAIFSQKSAVHQHCGEAGAIGAAMEAKQLYDKGHCTTFIGLEAVRNIRYRTTRSEETRCRFCKNHCLRTFLDIQTGCRESPTSPPEQHKLPLAPGERRVIIAGCEKGAVENLDRMREIKAGLDSIRAANPNLVDLASRESGTRAARPWCAIHPSAQLEDSRKKSHRTHESPLEGARWYSRVLNMYVYAPLFTAYLESLGVLSENIVFSDYTTNEMYRAGSSRGSIDPCFPFEDRDCAFSQPHLQQPQAPGARLHLSPMFDVLCSPLVRTRACNACPTVAVTPETVEAAYTKEINVFAENHIHYLHPIVNLAERKLFEQQMFECWSPLLGLSEDENHRAVQSAYEALAVYEHDIRRQARATLNMLEREHRLGIVMLGRPYHHDPGLNHGILDEFQKLGYSVFSQNTLPLDDDLLDRLFGDEVRAGIITHPLDISDVWKTATAASSNLKHYVVSSIIGLMYKLFDPNKTGIIGPRFEHAIRNAMLTVMYEPGSTFVEVVRILTDANYVQELLPKVTDPIIRRYWTDQIAQTSDFHKSEVLDYIVSKFGRFVTNKMIRNIIGQSDSAFNFRKVMDEKKNLTD